LFPYLLFSSNSSLTIVFLVSLLSLPKLLFFFHDTKLFYFIFLFVSLSSISFFQFWELSMRPSTTRASNNCRSKQCHATSKSCRSKQHYTTFESCRIKQCYCECLLHISFLFNFLVVNPAKHNDQQVFHLDFTFTLKIGKSHLPIHFVK
jgi:hypothetical protein